MADGGSSGVDVYRRAGSGPGRFVTSSHRASETKRVPGEFILQIPWTPGEDCIVNLPLYNGIREFALGIDPQASVEDAGPHRSGVEKPVVFYGTSITHGGCATRPGLGFVNIIGRRLDVPVVGLGFSGSGWMEYEMSEHLARIDASCYVLDCLGNMDLTETERPGRAVTVNYEKFIRNLRRKRPDAPIVMAEQGDVFSPDPRPKDRFVRALYEKLVAEGWKRLVYLPKDKMFSGDTEGTVDGVHPNDLGMMTMAEAYGGAVRAALELPER